MAPKGLARAARRIRDPSPIFDENLFKCDQPHTALADSRTSLTVGLHPKSRCTQASRRRLTWSILAYIHQNYGFHGLETYTSANSCLLGNARLPVSSSAPGRALNRPTWSP